MADDLLSDEKLREYFRNGTANITDEQIRGYLTTTLTDDFLKAQLLKALPGLLEEAKQKGMKPEDIEKQEKALREALTSPKAIEDTRQSILNNPEVVKQIREGLANPDGAALQQMREEINKSTTFAVARALHSACENGVIDAGMWGITAGAQFLVNSGSTSRMAELLSLGGKAPGVGTVVVGLIEGGFAINDFANGRNEQGSVRLGGAVGGTAGTLLAGAATVGALATAPAVVPLAVAAAIGVTCYYTGRNVGEICYLLYDINKIAGELDSQGLPDPENHRNLSREIPQILMNSYGGERGEELRTLVRQINGMKADDWVRPEDVGRALSHPQRGEEATAKLRELIQSRRDFFQQVENDNYGWRPRFMAFTNAQAARDQKWEMARISGRESESAMGELDGYVAQLKEIRKAAEAKAAEVLKPFNSLKPGVQTMIAANLEANYPNYRKNEEAEGRVPLDREAFLIAKKVEISGKKEVIAEIERTEEAVMKLAGKDEKLAQTLRREAMLEPEKFQARLAQPVVQAPAPAPAKAPVAAPVVAPVAVAATPAAEPVTAEAETPAAPAKPETPAKTVKTEKPATPSTATATPTAAAETPAVKTAPVTPPAAAPAAAQPASLSEVFNQAASLAEKHHLGMLFSAAASVIGFADQFSFLKPATDWLKEQFVSFAKEELVNQGVNLAGVLDTQAHAPAGAYTSAPGEKPKPLPAPGA